MLDVVFCLDGGRGWGGGGEGDVQGGLEGFVGGGREGLEGGEERGVEVVGRVGGRADD